jgi:hypothetical protein
VADSCEYGDEPSGSGATELVKTSESDVSHELSFLIKESELRSRQTEREREFAVLYRV